ncbi:MAG: hypothetical protein HW376_1240, partial [candidate division NC10 bacterium]|nr:hypothetical protein [candidate division NC10 bacterium]
VVSGPGFSSVTVKRPKTSLTKVKSRKGSYVCLTPKAGAILMAAGVQNSRLYPSGVAFEATFYKFDPHAIWPKARGDRPRGK